MYDGEKVPNIGEGNKKAPYKLVEALIDKILYEQTEEKHLEPTIKVIRNIKCIDDCDLKVVEKDIYPSENKKCWIAVIEFKLVIKFTTKYGTKGIIKETIYYEQEIPMPVTKKHCNDMDCFVKLIPKVFVTKAKCKKVEFQNIKYFSLVTPHIKFEVQALVITKEALLIRAYCPKPLK